MSIPKNFEFNTEIRASEIGKGGAFVAFPHDIRELYGKGRVKVVAYFDGVEYHGSIVNMGLKNPDGSICYILGITKSIRGEIHKDIEDDITVKIEVLL
ncbi:MAG: DUF1905 domain-containing protein [Lactobacillus sp.]|jgi:hypothetical protein|nr:DUF1905 domain-containing protein [Lactobacillus sp.]